MSYNGYEQIKQLKQEGVKMEIKKEIVTREVYKVGDKIICSEEDAKFLVENTKKLMSENEFYFVDVKPDLTEGRGYADKILVAAPIFTEINAVFTYLIENYGKPISLVQGCSPMRTYLVYDPKKYKSWDEIENQSVVYLNAKGEVCKYKKKIDERIKQIISESDNA